MYCKGIIYNILTLQYDFLIFLMVIKELRNFHQIHSLKKIDDIFFPKD